MSADHSDSLVDQHGKPFRKPQSDREALEAIIRAELADAKNSLRDSNQTSLNQIAETHYEPKLAFWKKTSFFGFVLSIIIPTGAILWALVRIPDWIDQKTQEFFREKFVGAALTNTVEMVISNRAAVLVDYRLAPLDARTIDLSNTTEKVRVDFLDVSQQLRRQLDAHANNLVLITAASTNAERILRALESKTAAYQLLPDGRIRAGGTILGSQDILIEGIKKEIAAYSANNYVEAYKLAEESIRIYEALPTATFGAGSVFGSGAEMVSQQGIVQMYAIGSHCAMLRQDRARALSWARLAFNHNAEPELMVKLVTLLKQNNQNEDAEALISDVLAKGGPISTNFANLLGIPAKK